MRYSGNTFEQESDADLAAEFLYKLTMAGVMAILLGAAILGFGLYSAKAVLKAQSWPVSQGQVLTSDLIITERKRIGKPGYDTSYIVDLDFEYRVDGSAYRSNRISFGQMAHSESEAQTYLERYQPGAIVSVTYNPQRPEHGALETGMPTGTRSMLWIGGGAVVVGVVVLIGVGLIRRKDAQLSQDAPPLARQYTPHGIAEESELMRRPI